MKTGLTRAASSESLSAFDPLVSLPPITTSRCSQTGRAFRSPLRRFAGDILGSRASFGRGFSARVGPLYRRLRTRSRDEGGSVRTTFLDVEQWRELRRRACLRADTRRFPVARHRPRTGPFRRDALSPWVLPTGVGAARVRVRDLLLTRDGSLLICTTGTPGVVRYRDGKLSPFSSRPRLQNTSVRTIAETRDGSIWIGTANAASFASRARERSASRRRSFRATRSSTSWRTAAERFG